MSASPTTEVATTTAITQMEVTLVPVIMAISSTVIDTPVKVSCTIFACSYTIFFVRAAVSCIGKYSKINS